MSLMEDLRVRIGLEPDDTSKDVEITAAKDSAFALMGLYCDRDFIELVDGVETFIHTSSTTLSLRRYPVSVISSIVDTDLGTIEEYDLNAVNGVIHFEDYKFLHHTEVTFTGGYDEDALPPDLLSAFYLVFDQEYATLGGATTSTAGEIESVTLADVGTVRFSTGESSDSGAVAYLPSVANAILEPYRRLQC